MTYHFAQLRVDRHGVTVGIDLVRQQSGYFSCMRGEVVKVREVVETFPTLGDALAAARKLNAMVAS